MKKKRVEELLALAGGKTKALIMPHDYADPDAIAAALAVSILLEKKLAIPSVLSCNGGVGRNENRVLCDCLDIELKPTRAIDFDAFDLYVLVDCQPGTGNNSFPEDKRADIIIDHHPPEGRLEGVRYIDIRDDCGSSSTILTGYFRDASLEIEKRLATALLYGIKSDAMNFVRKTREEDIRAYLTLFPLVDVEKLNLVEGAGLPREYFRVLKEAVGDAAMYDDVLVSDLGNLANPGMIGEFADLFLRLDEVNTVLCLGVYNEKLLISVRSLKPKVHAGKVIRAAVGRRGTAGGHETMAGGQIPLLTETRTEENEHKRAIIGRVFSLLGIEGKRMRKLA